MFVDLVFFLWSSLGGGVGCSRVRADVGWSVPPPGKNIICSMLTGYLSPPPPGEGVQDLPLR